MVELEIPQDDINTMPPHEFVAEKDKNSDWFLAWARYFCTYYNPLSYQWDAWNIAANKTNSGNDITNYQWRITDDFVNNFSYLFGQQPNINYAYLTQDPTNQVMTAPWIKGRKASMIVDFANGDMIDVLQNLTFDALSLSKDVIAKKENLFEQIYLAHELKEDLAPAAEMGISYKPYEKDLNSVEEIDNEKYTYRDELERDLIYIAEDIYSRNEMWTQYSKAYLNTLCGLGAIYNYVENGKQKKKIIPCYNTIFDNRDDGDYGQKMKFCGFIEYMTPAQCVNHIPDLANIPNAISELDAIAAGTATNLAAFYNYYNSSYTNNNFQWWRQVNGTNLVSVVTLFWIAPRDLKFKKYTNDYGQERVRTIRDDEKDESGQYLTMDVHTCKLVGNKWACDIGYAKNTVRDYNNKGTPKLPMSFYIPNMAMGMPRPLMGMIKKSQDELDRLNFKLRELQGRDYGKIPIVNAAAMGEMGKTALQFADDLKNVGILVARTSGEFQQMQRDAKLVDYVDLSNSQNMLIYLQLKAEEERQMEEIVGYSKIALGQQKGFVSGQVQAQSQSSASNVTKYVVEGFKEFMRRDMEYSCNVQKMLIGSGKDKDGDLVVGDSGVRLMKSLGDKKFEDMMLRLKFDSVIDEGTRQRLLAYAQAWSQNPAFGVTPAMILRLETEKSLTRLIDVFQMELKKNEDKIAAKEKMQQMLQMAQQQQQMENQNQQIQFQEEQANAREKEKNSIKVADTMLKHRPEPPTETESALS